jgi:CDP-diacylglycerol--serine O-phosphatidyltransferase
MTRHDSGDDLEQHDESEFGSPAHRRRRWRRHRRRVYIRSVYALPSLATLGNALCGFGAIYVSTLEPSPEIRDRLTNFFASHSFLVAAYLIFLAMLFDAIDGRLARFARHTTDFGGQLDSLADVISFGVAPAMLAATVFREQGPQDVPVALSRLMWAMAALYMSCAAIRLARFNVSNEHGEQHHFSFLGLPSPGAGGAVAGYVILTQHLQSSASELQHYGPSAAYVMTCFLPVLVPAMGLLMVSNLRYGHVVNRYLRGKRAVWQLVAAVAVVLMLIVAHEWVISFAAVGYALGAPITWAFVRLRRRTSTGPTPHDAPPPAAP